MRSLRKLHHLVTDVDDSISIEQSPMLTVRLAERFASLCCEEEAMDDSNDEYRQDIQDFLDTVALDLSTLRTQQNIKLGHKSAQLSCAVEVTLQFAREMLYQIEEHPSRLADPQCLQDCFAICKSVAPRLSMEESMVCSKSLRKREHLRKLATAQLIVEAAEIVASKRDAEMKRRPRFLRGFERDEFNAVDRFLQRKDTQIDKHTLRIWLQVCAKLRAGSTRLLRKVDVTVGWAKQAINAMPQSDLILSAVACGFLNMRTDGMSGAILARLEWRSRNKQLHATSPCMSAQLAHAIALLNDGRYTELCATAVRRCGSVWQCVSGASKSTLNTVLRFLKRAQYPNVEQLLQDRRADIKAHVDASHEDAKNQYHASQDRVYQRLANDIIPTTWADDGRPAQEVQTHSGATSSDVYSKLRSGLELSWQFEGPQHYVEWFDNDPDVDKEAKTQTPEQLINNGTACRNDDQQYEGYTVISIHCQKFDAIKANTIRQQKAMEARFLAKCLIAAEASWAEGKAVVLVGPAAFEAARHLDD